MAQRASGKKKAAKKRAVPRGATGSRGSVAKVSKKAAIGDNSGEHGVPDEVYHRHLRAIERTATAMEKAKEAYDQTRGEHRSAYKVAKDDGCDIEAIKLARKLDQTDHGIVVTTYSNTGRILALMRSPLSTQLELFADMAPVVKKAEEEGIDQALAGAHAFSNAEPKENNPHIPGTMKFGQWEAGWLRAQRGMGARQERKRLALASIRLQGQGSRRRSLHAGLRDARRRLVLASVQRVGEAQLYA